MFTSCLKIKELRELGSLSKTNEHLVKVVVCGEDEHVCCKNSFDPTRSLCFFYTTIFTNVKLRLPLSVLKKKFVDRAQCCSRSIASEQLAFIQAFVILCSQFDISPTVDVFFYFFEFKSSGRELWALLNSVSRRGLLFLFQSSYENFKGWFIKVHPSIGDPTLLDCFPLCWSPNPHFKSVRHLEDLVDPRERGMCEFLENLKVIFDTLTILTREYLLGSLQAYIGILHSFQPKFT